MEWASNRGENSGRIPLLSTKLHPARTRSFLLPRLRLTEKLDEGLHCKLTIIAAPAGYGKTTLLSEWARRRNRAAAWLSLDALDNDPVTFWAYFIGALQILQPGLGAASLDALYSDAQPPIEQALAPLINELAAVSVDFSLVLDDYHTIVAPAIHASLSFFIERMPSTLHLYITGRREPPLRLTRLRAEGELLEIRLEEMRFTSEECFAFIQNSGNAAVTREEAVELAGEADGWIAGLRLVQLAIADATTPTFGRERRSGIYRYLAEYVATEILEVEPAESREFLLQTAILKDFNESVCDAVTGGADSAARVEYLAGAGLFVCPSTRIDGWFSYHPLFANVTRWLLEEESPELLPVLHRRASVWFQRNGRPAEAVDHMIASGDFEQAAVLAARYAEAVLATGDHATILSWRERLPHEQVIGREPLLLAITWALLLSGDLQTAEAYVEPLHRSTGRRPESGLADVASHLDAIDDFLAFARKSTPVESDRPAESRSTRRERLNAEALADIKVKPSGVMVTGEGEESSKAPGNDRFAVLDALPQLGALQVRMGQLKAARKTFQRVIDEQPDTEPTPSQARSAAASYIGIAQIDYETDSIDRAMANVGEGLALARPLGDPMLIHDGYVLMARVQKARGDIEEAFDALDEAERQLTDVGAGQSLSDSLAAHRAHLWLSHDHLPAALDWAGEYDPDAEDPSDDLSRFRMLTFVRVLIARKEFDRAHEILNRLLQAGEERGWGDITIPALVLQTTTHLAQGDERQAAQSIGGALKLASAQHYFRSIVDEGPVLVRPLRRLLEEIPGGSLNGTGETIRPYLESLVAALGEAVEGEGGEAGGRQLNGYHPALALNPLSEREVEVLKLISAGKSNSTIAQALFISVSTVKTHINNLYSKLGVESRTQALMRGRELNLI
ncbi:MAG TPA: LuxR C-terminal-related transcriptional regulator [Candidatus Kapabacteria bacterium]|nr:LuxR C-terminal-related transcriptional regulator [Candidatus Kapabacteria bacterium]